MDIRPFQPADRAACLAIYDSLDPKAPDAAGRLSFESFLENPDGPYFVMEHEDAIVGCGGYALSSDKTTARLLWGIIGSGHRRLGLGRFLLLYRVREIGRVGSVQTVRVKTARSVAPFFEKQGFRVTNNDLPGPEPIELTKKLTVCP